LIGLKTKTTKGINMNRLNVTLSFTAVLFSLSGCNDTVDWSHPTAPDPTPVTVDMVFTRPNAANLEVMAATVPQPSTAWIIPTLPTGSEDDFSIVATAKDPESGVATVSLSVQRTVCFVASDGSISSALQAPEVRKQASYPNRAKAPVTASLGDTVYVSQLLVFQDANGHAVKGVGVKSVWTMQATNNQSALPVFSNAIKVGIGNTTCP
jgi:hypothetical protein